MSDVKSRLQELVSLYEGGNATKFAINTGISQSTLHNYLQGRKPNIESLIRIHEKYGTNINWLLTGDGDMTRGKDERHGKEVMENHNAYVTGRDIGISNVAGNNNHIRIVMDKKTRNGDKSLDAVAMLTKILASGNERIINATLTHLQTMADLSDQK